MNRIISFMIGLAAGTVLGMLAAPGTGWETRRKIMEEADKMLDQALVYKKKIASRTGSKRSTTV